MIDEAYLQRLRDELTSMETEMSQPEVSSNRERFRELMTRHTRQKKVLDAAQAVWSLVRTVADSEEVIAEADDEELRAMAEEELAEARGALPAAETALKLTLLPPDDREGRNVILEIRAGTGGDEAAIFAGDLYRMYQRFAEARGWKAELLDASPSELGGYKEVTLSVEGADAFQTLQYESGVHRVQRVPVTESQGRIHTSAATVAVLTEAEDVELRIAPEDVRIDIFRSSGPGGQSVNTTDSAVRVTHIATGVVATCQDEKSQHRNKEKAMRVLRARLHDALQREEAAKQSSQRRSQIGSGDRSERIRTYNFPQNRLTDHRINLTLYSLDRIVEGDLDDLTSQLRTHDLESRMQAQMDEGPA